MSLTDSEIKKIAKLARIAISDQDLAKISTRFHDIFQLVAKMQSVDTDHVEPMAYPHTAYLKLREDIPKASCVRDEFLPLSPQSSEDGFFLVPQAIE